MRRLLFLGLITSLFLVNCTEDDLSLNPYDGIDYSDTTLVIDTVSATSFVKLHRDVLGPSCNVMGCHDGSFEPDFRTVQSSYNTLVYHPILKNLIFVPLNHQIITAIAGMENKLDECLHLWGLNSGLVTGIYIGNNSGSNRISSD